MSRKTVHPVLALMVSCAVAMGGVKGGPQKHPSKIHVAFAHRMLQGFTMRVWLSNQMTMGLQAWGAQSAAEIPVEPRFGLEYPVGSGIEHLVGAGPLIGGIINGSRRVDEGYNPHDGRSELLPEYRHIVREHFWHTFVGASDPGLNLPPDSIGHSGYYYNTRQWVDRRGCDDDRDGRVDEDELDGVDNDGDWNPLTDDVGSDGVPDSLEVGRDGKAYDPVTNPDPAGDNYVRAPRDTCIQNPDGSWITHCNKDIWTEKNGMPDHGEPNVDEDYAAISDNDLYCSAIDTFRTPLVPGHVPMGIKVIQKSYAWKGKYTEAILPIDYYFINVGRNVIRDVWAGFWADMDIGPVNSPNYPQNNYAGYMHSLYTPYIHNPVDRGSTPLGLTLLQTPRTLDSLIYIFQWKEPLSRSEYPWTNDSILYSWMSGEMFPTGKVAENQDPNALSDTRFFFSVGRFGSLNPRDTLKISFALVSGYGIAEGRGNLTENIRKAILTSARRYTLSPELPSPVLRIAHGPKSDTLRWGKGNGSADPMSVWDPWNILAGSYPDNHWRRRDPPCGDPGICGSYPCDPSGQMGGGKIFRGYRLYRSEDPGNWPSASSFSLLQEYVHPEEDTTGSDLEYQYVDSNLAIGKRYWYAVTSFGLPEATVNRIPLPDGSSWYDTVYAEGVESDILENAQSVDLEFIPSKRIGEVLVVPNPYRTDRYYSSDYQGWEGPERSWRENNRLIKFIHLPEGEWTIRVFSLAGDVITTIENRAGMGDYDPKRGEVSWHLVSESGKALASGLYVFTVESGLGTQTGTFAVIR